jgi:hypothetical protein
MQRQVVERIESWDREGEGYRLSCNHTLVEVAGTNRQPGDVVECGVCPAMDEQASKEANGVPLADQLAASMVYPPGNAFVTEPEPFIPLPMLSAAVIELAQRVRELEAKLEVMDA